MEANPTDWPPRIGLRSIICLKRTALALSQLLARLISSTRSTYSSAFSTTNSFTDGQQTARGPASTRPHNRFAPAGGTRELSLRVIDLAQGWSGTVRTRSSQTGLLAMVAGVYNYITVHLFLVKCTFHTPLTPTGCFHCPHSRKNRSFTKKLSSYSDFASKW